MLLLYKSTLYLPLLPQPSSTSPRWCVDDPGTAGTCGCAQRRLSWLPCTVLLAPGRIWEELILRTYRPVILHFILF